MPGVPPFVFVGAESAPVAPATGAEERIDASETPISGADSSMYPTPLVSEPRALPPKTEVYLTPEFMDGVTATLEGPLASEECGAWPRARRQRYADVNAGQIQRRPSHR